MNKNYKKPIIIANDELAEGVYMNSGNCYTFTARVVQQPALGAEWYTVQVDGQHNTNNGHHSSSRTVVIEFNQPVEYRSSNAMSCAGSGTSSLALTYTDGINGAYHNNAQDNIGLGQLTVISGEGLAVNRAYCTFCNEECGYIH